MSLPEWIIWLQEQLSVSFITFPALLLFISLYIVTKWGNDKRDRARLLRLHRSLQLYAAAIGPLLRSIQAEKLTPEDRHTLLDVLLGLKASPYITSDLNAQINAYAQDQDPSRLALLARTLEREIERLIDEQDKLLRTIEVPSWGYSLWKQVYPIIPFVVACILFYQFGWLLQLIGNLYNPDLSTMNIITEWSHFASALLSLIVIYPVLMSRNRPNAVAMLHKAWSILIALLFLLHLIHSMYAPYILTLQVILLLIGYRFTDDRSRKSRPFAGHYPAAGEDAGGEDRTDAADTTIATASTTVTPVTATTTASASTLHDTETPSEH